MNRTLMNNLVNWKEAGITRPLLLTGTKGTGKTYLALDFAKNWFPQYIYIDFEHNIPAREYFTAEILEGKAIETILAAFYQLDSELLKEMLVIMDEISFCPSVFLNLSHYHFSPVLAISGLQPEEQMYHNFEVCKMYPLGFDEFLSAVGNDWYIDIIKGHFATEQPIPDIVHQELLGLFEEYLTIGGMPAAINEYLNTRSIYNVAEVQYGILRRIECNLSMLSEAADASKALQVFEVLPAQLARENKKFKFNQIRKGVTYTMYQDGLRALMLTNSALLLYQEEKDTHFKLYYPDTGLLSMQYTGRETEEIRKAILENYVMQVMNGKEEYKLTFWESEAVARVDFLFDKNGETTPVELRLSSNSKSKSVAAYVSSHKNSVVGKTLRICFNNFHTTEVTKQIPFYSLFCL